MRYPFGARRRPTPSGALHLFEELRRKLGDWLFARPGKVRVHARRFVFGEFVQEGELLCGRADGYDAVAQGHQVDGAPVADRQGIDDAQEAGCAARPLGFLAPPAKASYRSGNDDDHQRQSPGKRNDLSATK